MPLAPDVPAETHRCVPPATADAAGRAGPCSGALKCPHMAGLCPALATLFASKKIADSSAANEWTKRIAPCGSCRVAFESGRAVLRGVRLGQREREVLIGASQSESFAVTAPGMTRSLSAARRRAAQQLIGAGLVASVAEGARGRATVELTALGHYVMAAYGRFILTGKPVRWDRPASKVALPGRDPHGLVDEAVGLTQTAMRETLDELKRVLIAAVGRPVKDPMQLDRVTRHLERKATGLRELLEPVV
ncbi:MAG: hypothetical protein WC807_10970 [Hyphomicrobium sp.]